MPKEREWRVVDMFERWRGIRAKLTVEQTGDTFELKENLIEIRRSKSQEEDQLLLRSKRIALKISNTIIILSGPVTESISRTPIKILWDKKKSTYVCQGSLLKRRDWIQMGPLSFRYDAI